jgi:hypothetical protein
MDHVENVASETVAPATLAKWSRRPLFSRFVFTKTNSHQYEGSLVAQQVPEGLVLVKTRFASLPSTASKAPCHNHG